MKHSRILFPYIIIILLTARFAGMLLELNCECDCLGVQGFTYPVSNQLGCSLLLCLTNLLLLFFYVCDNNLLTCLMPDDDITAYKLFYSIAKDWATHREN